MASIVRNSIYNTLGIVVYITAMFLITPLLINTMGDVQYGLFRLALYSVVGYCVLLDMGFANGIIRTLANRMALGDIEAARKVTGLAVYIFSIISVLIFILDIFLIIWFPAFVHTPPELVFPFRLLLFSTAVFLSFSFFNNIWCDIFAIKARYECIQLTKLLGRVSFMFVAWLLMKYYGNPLIMMTASVLVITPIVFIGSMIWAKRVWPEMGFSMRKIDTSTLKEIAAFGSQWFVITLSGIILFSSIDVMLGRYVGLAAVTLMSVPLMIANQFVTVIGSITAPMFPEIAKLGVNKENKKILSLYMGAINVAAFMFVGMFVPVGSFMEPLLKIWVNPDFVSVENVAVVLLCGYFYTVLELSSMTIIKATGRVRVVSILHMTTAIISLSSIFVLLKYFDGGLMSIAVVLTIVQILRSILILRETAPQFGGNWVKIFFNVLLRTIPIVIVLYITSKLFALYFNPQNIFTLAFGMGLSVVISLAISYFVILGNEQRAYVSKIFRSRFGKYFGIG